MTNVISRMWPGFLALAFALTVAGCYVSRSAGGYIDLQPTEAVKPLSDAANSVVEPITGMTVEDIGGALVDSADEAAKVAVDASSGNYAGLVSSLAALIAALGGSVAYRRKRAKAKANAARKV